MGLTGFSLCDPKALSSVLRYNTVVRGIVLQSAVEKRVSPFFATGMGIENTL